MSLFLLFFSFYLPVLPGGPFDKDGDGHRRGDDCSDTDPLVWVLWCPDLDGDGVGDRNLAWPPECGPRTDTPHTWYPTCEY